jgi:hypothetical protein
MLTVVGDDVIVVIDQFAATMCMKVPMFDTRPAIHSER